MTVNDSNSEEGGRPLQQNTVGQAPPSRAAHRKQLEEQERAAKKRSSGKKPWYQSAGGALKLVILVAGVALLWPSSLGGLTGLTVVQGHSMEPTYYTGDLVLTVRKASYDVGDVISYKVSEGQQGAGGRVIHRIVEVGEEDGPTVYTTEGDNNDAPDIWVVTNRDVQGAAVGHVQGLGKLLGGQTYGVILALTAGVIVTVVLWPSGKTKSSKAKKGEGEGEDDG